MKPTFVYALVTVAAAVTACAEDFPLTFKTIPAQDAMSFPGGPGSYGPLRTAKPAKLKNEPKAISRNPLYGECGGAGKGPGFIFRLDESKGDGRGYDQLIVDMNQNGDLTDDAVAPKVALPGERRTESPDQGLFGPIQAPADKAVAGGRPVYFAQVYVFNRQMLNMAGQARNLFIGQLMLKPGWYLDTTVKLNGLQQKVGVLDGNCNLRLGDIDQPITVTNRGERMWYFQSGDYLLVDTDGSGAFNNDVFQSEVRPFGPILYLGSKAYEIALSPDNKSLRLEPWAEPMAEVSLQPGGEQVHDVTLAWERPNGHWQLIKPAVTQGKVLVPAGNYRLYACSLLGKATARDQVMLSGTQRSPQSTVGFAVGKANKLACGAPLQIKVNVPKGWAESRGMPAEGSWGMPAGSRPVLGINASVVGAGGEIYSTFLTGPRFKARPAKPTFDILDAAGKRVDFGNLEYG